MMDDIIKDFNKVAVSARQKADYMRLRPISIGTWNWEQSQTPSDVLEELARQIEAVIAKYVKEEELTDDLKQVLSRQCKTAIRNRGKSLVFGL